MRKKAIRSDKPDNSKKEKFLSFLEEARGIVSVACQNFKISRETHYQWMQEEWYAKRVSEINESVIDFVEGKLFQKIEGILIGKMDKEGELQVFDVPPSDTAIIFYLKTRAKSRGYIERQELDHTTKGEKLPAPVTRPIVISVEGIPKSLLERS